jgi:predicted dehydrogenase
VTIGAAIVGLGYWGPNLARNLILHKDFELLSVVDKDVPAARNKLDAVGGQNIEIKSSLDGFFSIPGVGQTVQLVCIATPPETHKSIALELLRGGFSLLIEKPVGLSLQEKLEIVQEASKRNLKVFVDHTYLHTSEFLFIEESLRANVIGKPTYFLSNRVNLGLVQESVSVIQDLAVHDLSILDHLIGDLPDYVNCIAQTVSPSRQFSSALIQASYPNGFMASINVSWNSPVKLRDIYIAGESGMISWNDLAGFDKVKIFHGRVLPTVDRETAKISYHLGGGTIPSITFREALKSEFDQIASSFLSDTSQMYRNEQILRMGAVLDALEESARSGGQKVKLK